MVFGSTEYNSASAFPKPLQGIAIAARAESIRLLLPKSTLEGDALRFAGYLKLKQLQMGKRDRLVALRNMQNRFPIGERVVHNGMKYAVEGVIPTVSAADCRDGTPSGDRMFTLRLRGTDGVLHRVLVADLVQELPSSED